MKKISWVRLTISILIALGVGFLSWLLSMGNMESYNQLIKPVFSPPSWIFGVVWPILYILMGIAAYRVYSIGIDDPKVKSALYFYGIQLVLNFFWSILFFRFELRGIAFFELLLLFASIVITTVMFYKLDKISGILLIPYIIWVTFASILNYSIWMLN